MSKNLMMSDAVEIWKPEIIKPPVFLPVKIISN